MGAGLVLFYPDGDFCTGNLPLWLFLAARPSSDRSDKRAAPTNPQTIAVIQNWWAKHTPRVVCCSDYLPVGLILAARPSSDRSDRSDRSDKRAAPTNPQTIAVIQNWWAKHTPWVV